MPIPTTQPSKPSTSAIVIFASMLGLYCINYFLRAAIPGTIFNQLQQDLCLNAKQIAMIGASYTYVYALSQIFVGLVIDHYGGIRVNIVGGLLFAVSALCFPLCQNRFLIYGLRMLTGLGASTMFLGLVYETNHVFGHKNYALVMSFAYLAAYLGGLLASLPFAYVCEKYPWRNVLLVCGILALVMYLFFVCEQHYLRRGPIQPVVHERTPWQSFIHVVRRPLSWSLCCISVVIFSLSFIIMTVFGKKFLEDVVGLPSLLAAQVIFSMSLAIMLSSFLGSLCSRLWKNKRRPFIRFAGLTNFLSTLAIVLGIRFHAAPAVFIVSFVVCALASGLSSIVFMSMQEVNSQKDTTLVTGVINMMNYLGVAVFSLLTGCLLDAFDLTPEGTYPAIAYLRIFEYALIPTALALVLSLRIPETEGKYLEE